jgi:hypothetical protein
MPPTNLRLTSYAVRAALAVGAILLVVALSPQLIARLAFGALGLIVLFVALRRLSLLLYLEQVQLTREVVHDTARAALRSYQRILADPDGAAVELGVSLPVTDDEGQEHVVHANPSR